MKNQPDAQTAHAIVALMAFHGVTDCMFEQREIGRPWQVHSSIINGNGVKTIPQPLITLFEKLYDEKIAPFINSISESPHGGPTFDFIVGRDNGLLFCRATLFTGDSSRLKSTLCLSLASQEKIKKWLKRNEAVGFRFLYRLTDTGSKPKLEETAALLYTADPISVDLKDGLGVRTSNTLLAIVTVGKAQAVNSIKAAAKSLLLSPKKYRTLQISFDGHMNNERLTVEMDASFTLDAPEEIVEVPLY